jgi:hypothetical protein
MPNRAAAAIAVGLALSGVPAAGARAQLFERDEHFPLDPPLALPQQLNGTIRGSSPVAEVARVDRIRDVFPAIRACWRPPASGEGPTGLQVTVRLSFKRSGEVLGKPQITYFKAGGERHFQERFAASVMSAFAQCTPLPFTAALGSAIAGRPFTFRFIDDRQT